MIEKNFSLYRSELLLSTLTLLVILTASSWYWIGIEAANVIGSTGLSITLVALYFYQSTIQGYQSEVMDEQKELKSAEYAPEIDIEEFAPLSQSVSQSIDKDSVTFGLVNYGSGVAKAPSVVLEVTFNEDTSLKSFQNHIPLNKIGGNSNPPAFTELTKLIPPGGEVMRFHAPLSVVFAREEDEGRVDLSFNEYIHRIYEEGVTKLNIKISISTHNVLDERFEYKVLDFDIDLDSMLESDLRSEEKEDEEMFYFTSVFRYGMATTGEALAGDGIPVSPEEPTDKTGEILLRSVSRAIEDDMDVAM